MSRKRPFPDVLREVLMTLVEGATPDSAPVTGLLQSAEAALSIHAEAGAMLVDRVRHAARGATIVGYCSSRVS